MTPPSWQVRSTGDERVCEFDCTLLWPLRIEADGSLRGERGDANFSPGRWLERYADFVANQSESEWERQPDPYASRFGTPNLYPDPERAYQEFVYFHPFIQNLLYQRDSNRRVMAVLSRHDIQGAEVQLRCGEILRFDVPRVQLFLFTTDVAIAAVQLSNPKRLSESATNFESVNLSLHTAMDLLNQVRRVYPPYWRDGVAPDTPKQFCWLTGTGTSAKRIGDIGLFDNSSDYCSDVFDHRRPPVAAHWRTLLAPLIPWNEPSSESAVRPDGLHFRQIEDDRIPVQSFLAVDRPQDISSAEFMRLAFIDCGGPDWPWSRKFLRGKEAEHWYDRSWHYQTRYLSAGYSFVLVMNSENNMRDVLRLHMQHHYFKMFLIAHLQKASLLVAWERLSHVLQIYAGQPTGEESRRQFHDSHRWLAEDLASYTAIFEFSEVTNQIQGRELFQLMRRHLGSADLFAEMVKQLEFARMVEQGNYSESLVASQLSLQRTANDLVQSQLDLQKVSTRLQDTANHWIPLFLALSFLGLSIGVQSLQYWIDTPHPTLFGRLPVVLQRIAVFATMVLVTWLVFFGLYQLLRRWSPRERK